MTTNLPFITQDLNLALKDLRSGKPVAIPTETVYGLAATIDNEVAIRQIFALKNRPLNHPLIIHVAPNIDLNPYISSLPTYAKTLIENFWPGPLTLILPANPNINPLITAGQNNVALRCPRHPLTEQLLITLNNAVVAPSANPFGKMSPTSASHVQHAFLGQNFTILDGGRCSVGIESTIVDATQQDSYQILRQGLISETTLGQVIPTTYKISDTNILAPGLLNSHYQPNKTLYYFDTLNSLEEFCLNNSNKVYALANKHLNNIDQKFFHLLTNTPEALAFELYYQLWVADKSTAECIAILLPPNTQAWYGIRERILKAGTTGK